MRIKVLNWQKYNQRTSGYRKVWWLSLSNTFLEDPEIWEFTAAEKIALIYILCQASKQQKEDPWINLKQAVKICDIKVSDFETTIRKAESFQILAKTCTGSDQDLYGTEQEVNRKLTEHKSNAQFFKPSDFEWIYRKYPKKMGKAAGLDKCSRTIASRQEMEDLNRALKRFVAHHEAEGTQQKYIPYFSTFISSWRDWLEPDTGSVDEEIDQEKFSKWCKKNSKDLESMSFTDIKLAELDFKREERDGSAGLC